MKPSSPKLGTSQGRISHAFRITMFEMKVYVGLPNFVVSRTVISNACDPPIAPPFKRALEWLVPVSEVHHKFQFPMSHVSFLCWKP